MVPRPLAEPDLANELGFQPDTASHFCEGQPAAAARARFLRQPCERTIRPNQLFKFCVERLQLPLIEAGADLGSELQLAAFVVADEDRSEVSARSFRTRVAPDDEFL